MCKDNFGQDTTQPTVQPPALKLGALVFLHRIYYLTNLRKCANVHSRMRNLRNSDIPDLLRKLQGERSQKELADELGISPQHLSDLLSGYRMPGKALRHKIGIEKRVIYVLVTK